ncbi:MAG: prepilin peptidase [Cetobacterium sp.]
MVKYIIYFIVCIILIEIVRRDTREKIVLNKSNLGLLLIGIYLGFLENNLEMRVIGSAVYTLPFLFIYAYGSDLLQKECLGVGDIKLMSSLGMLLGFKNFYTILIFLNLSFMSALFFIISKYLITKKIDKEIAFGPFLIVAYIFIQVLEIYDKY